MKCESLMGRKATLKILRMGTVGAYVGTDDDDPEHGGILLPQKQLPENAKVHDKIEVFIYRDSEDRPIATVHTPYAETGEFAYLTVKGSAKVGAFLDWGLEKDLFVPFKEQEESLSPRQNVLAYVYLDKSSRLAATTRIYNRLSSADVGLFRKDDAFTGVVYRVEKAFGAFVAVYPENLVPELGKSLKKAYFGLIPASQIFQPLHLGDVVTGRIVRVRDDGKMDLDMRKKDYEQMATDAEIVLERIRDFDGVLPFSENASPELIKRELHMSKNGFKRALGHLYKERKIEIGETEVRLLPEENGSAR